MTYLPPKTSTATAALALAGDLAAQAPPPMPKLLSSKELARQAQTPGATGDQERHYFFAKASNRDTVPAVCPTQMESQLQTPDDCVTAWSLRTHDTMLTVVQGILKTLAEEHGNIVVSPLGYGPLGGYGQHYDIGMRPPVEGATAEEQERASRFSEADVMKVAALVSSEYGVDESGVFRAFDGWAGHLVLRRKISR